MRSEPPSIEYKFGCFLLRPAERQLLCEGRPTPLAPKAFDTLLLLIENHGRLVTKDEFLKRVWLDSFVEEVSLAHAISEVRKALRGGSNESDFIETVPKRGYRFTAPLEEINRTEPPHAARMIIGVLPVENLAADPGQEYLADGLTEEMIAALGQVAPEHLGVIGRTSMMAYKRTTKSLAEIGVELGAMFLLENSMRAESGRLRITSRLVRARDQAHLWSGSYDRQPGSLLEFQRELSTAIAEQVCIRLSPERMNVLARRHSQDVEAYDVYLRGRYFWTQLSPLTTRRAIEFFTRATEVDPGYALAWSGLADAYAASPINGDASPLQVWPRARNAATQAVSFGPDLAEAQSSLGLLKLWLDWDWEAAETAFRKALELDPSYSLADRTLGIVLSFMSRHDEALRAMRRARESDPLDFVHHALSAQVAFFARDYVAAAECARRANVLNPEFWIGYWQLAQAYEQLGENDLAFEALQKAGQFSGGNSKVIALRGYLFAKLGRTGEAREVLNTLEAVSRDRYVPPYATALVHAGLRQADAAFEWLNRAFDAHDVHLVFLTGDVKWDAFRSDPRMIELLNGCGFSCRSC